MCDGPCKTANEESLARDEGGCCTPQLREVTYKTVHGCQLRTTPVTATNFFRPWMQLSAEPLSSEGGHGSVCDDQAARRTT